VFRDAAAVQVHGLNSCGPMWQDVFRIPPHICLPDVAQPCHAVDGGFVSTISGQLLCGLHRQYAAIVQLLPVAVVLYSGDTTQF
jgi:hypothetical protein